MSSTVTTQPQTHRVRRIGGWLPESHADLINWINERVKRVRANPPQTSQVVQDFKNLVYNDPRLYMLFTEMLTEVPAKYKHDPSGANEICDIDTLFQVFDSIIIEAPSWNTSEVMGAPIYTVLNWPMSTKAGFAAFLKNNVNAQFKKMLNAWGQYLTTPESCSTLTVDPPNGWFQPAAMPPPQLATFLLDFECDQSKPHFGFTSWDNFFTRSFRPNRRPVAFPNDDSYIVNACESTPFSMLTDVKLLDTFWIKSHPYSLAHMMNNDPHATSFVGGKVYQAFLSADSYHRWHAPVSGTVVSSTVVDGTYYSEPPFSGFSPDSGDLNPDPGADYEPQGYLSSVATRGVVFFQADNPDIGLMCMIFVGMSETSSVDISKLQPPLKGPMPHFNKGDEIGMFHYGGSTYCLIFRPGVNVKFLYTGAEKMNVCSVLAQVTPA